MTLHDDQKKMLADLLQPGRRQADKGAQLHANNIRETLTQSLRDSYPMAHMLLGEDYFRQSAHAYIALSPPVSGDLNLYGDSFADFLKHLPGMADYLYVPDIAAMEWLAHEAALQPLLAPLDASALADVADPVNLRLQVQPHLRLLRSGWPVDKLWARLSAEGKALGNFDLQPQESFIAIYREEDRIAVATLSEGGYAFLEHLQANGIFAFAAEAALRADPDMALDRALALFVQNRFFAAPQ